MYEGVVVQGLTAVVSHGAADSLLVDGLATFHVQRALLHHAGRLIPYAVTQLARLLQVRRHLKAKL